MAFQPTYTNSWALVVGANDYDHAPKLEYAVNDARAFCRILKEQFRFPDTNVCALLERDATREGILTSRPIQSD